MLTAPLGRMIILQERISIYMSLAYEHLDFHGNPSSIEEFLNGQTWR